MINIVGGYWVVKIDKKYGGEWSKKEEGKRIMMRKNMMRKKMIEE